MTDHLVVQSNADFLHFLGAMLDTRSEMFLEDFGMLDIIFE
jgi:hypothetical protein